MGVLGKGEAWLERSVDRVFSGLFGAKLSPRAVLRAIEDAVTQLAGPDGQPRVANRYLVRLAPDDHQALAAKLPEVAQQARERVWQTADQRAWVRPTRVVVRLTADESVPAGAVSVMAGYEAGPGAAELVSLDGRTRLHFAGKTLQIGREETSDLLLTSSEVSRRHARIEVRDDQYVVVDLGSSNGTTVNGATVTQAALRDGDVLSFGPVAFTFRER